MGVLRSIDIAVFGGDKTGEKWADCPSTYLGMQITSFFYLFTLPDPRNAHPSATFLFVSSMSAVRGYYDNAAADSFWGLSSRETVYRRCYTMKIEACSEIFDDIKRFYNHGKK